MMPLALFIILDLVLSIAILSGIVGLLVWSIATPGRNQHVGSAARSRRQRRPTESTRLGEAARSHAFQSGRGSNTG
jgi:hypothetical protein